MGNLNKKIENFFEGETKGFLTIYTCGNIKEMSLFGKKELRENYTDQDFKFDEIKHPKFDWIFNFYREEFNSDLINTIMGTIIESHKNKNISNNSVILMFLNSEEKIKENRTYIQILFENFEKLSKIYKPFLIFAFKNKKGEDQDENENEENINKNENIIDDIILENKFNKYFIKKYIEIVNYSENYYSELIKKINFLYYYFNNIGDIFSILDEMVRSNNFYNNKRRNQIKYLATFNILVIGRPGCGKSTLINLLLNKRKAREGIGESITRIVSKYVHDDYPLTFEDTPGFEDNNDLMKMIKFLDYSKRIFGDGKNKFHLTLYLINGSNERTFIGEEVQLINFIEKQMKIPIFFVCTRSKNEEYAKDFKEAIKLNLWQNFGVKTNLVNHIYCCHLQNEKDGIYKRFGINGLLNGIKDYYQKEIENKENELFYNKQLEISNDSIFLSGLRNPEKFGDYLDKIALNIIEEYEYFTYLEEMKKQNNDENNNKDKINEMLVDHLSLELNGNSRGNIFCLQNRKQILAKARDNVIIEQAFFCKTKSQDEHLKDITIKDEAIKNSIRITREFGMEAKKIFLNKLKNDGLENYLKNIIEVYKEAIESLAALGKIIE